MRKTIDARRATWLATVYLSGSGCEIRRDRPKIALLLRAKKADFEFSWQGGAVLQGSAEQRV